MTYIKWKDEVESYLVSLPQEEKQKIFSYFSEMYADKRDAGKSEEQIIEEFGAPYDVAKKILSDSRDAAAQNSQPDGGANVSGGNNYNYNYYNYNYGGAPAQSPPPDYGYTPPKQTEAEPQPDVFGEGLKMPKKSKPKKTSVWRVLFGILFVRYVGGLGADCGRQFQNFRLRYVRGFGFGRERHMRQVYRRYLRRFTQRGRYRMRQH